MYQTGESPGKGTYVCMACGKKVVIENDDEKLPVCPQCQGSMYR
ncbi:MAG: DUF3039 domain-containing protein [Desulfopila sp.]